MQDIKTEKKELQKILKKIPEKKKIEVGDIVFGKIRLLKSKMAVVNIDSAKNNKVVSPNDSGVLLIRDISNDYVKDIKNYYRVGDVIKAKVIEVGDYEYKLSTKHKNLGVIQGFCKNCNKELSHTKSQNKVICSNCNTIQTKKFAK